MSSRRRFSTYITAAILLGARGTAWSEDAHGLFATLQLTSATEAPDDVAVRFRVQLVNSGHEAGLGTLVFREPGRKQEYWRSRPFQLDEGAVIRFEGAANAPAAEYRRWKRMSVPQLVLEWTDSEGHQRVLAVDTRPGTLNPEGQ